MPAGFKYPYPGNVGLRGLASMDSGGGTRPGLLTGPTAARIEDAPAMLAEGCHSTRLETRTKESNMYASRWVANP